MKISEFAQACGSSVRMVRFYETLNLIEPKRNTNGYRQYSPDDNKTGIPLKDLALMHDCLRDEPQNFCTDLRGRLMERLNAIDGQVSELQQSKALLSELLAR